MQESDVALARGKVRQQRDPAVHSRGEDAARREHRKTRWKNAFHEIGAAVEHDPLSDEARTGAEPASPERVPEQDHRIGTRAIVVRIEASADRGVNAEEPEQRPRGCHKLNLFGLTTVREVHAQVHQASDAREGGGIV